MIFNKVSLKSKPWVKRHHITNCSIVVPVYKGDYQGFNVWLALLAEHKLGEVDVGSWLKAEHFIKLEQNAEFL